MDMESKIRKIVREILSEELGREQRYVSTMEFYIWASSDEDAVLKSKEMAREMDMKLDNRASITSIVKQLQGTIGNTPIEISEDKK